MALTLRQQSILDMVAERYIRTGVPVSSKDVATVARFKVSPSTIRNEFAVLEELGYLTHLHTSGGRQPTNEGFREFVGRLMQLSHARETGLTPVNLSGLAKEVDVALQQTSEALSEATNLLALVVAPRVSGARVRHIELLALQPNLVMVVFILSTGRVSKRVIDFPRPADPGMVEWARTYLNEVIGERMLTERLVRRTLDSIEISAKEREFLHLLRPAMDALLDEQSEEALYVGGAARLLAESRFPDLGELREVLQLLEERYQLLRSLRSALPNGKVVVRIGEELEPPSLRHFALVTASYGLPQRSLGAVSVLGPVRMDYESAISTVRSTAQLLSAFLEDRYE
jgi:heat-inducible transcriptional repressor